MIHLVADSFVSTYLIFEVQILTVVQLVLVKHYSGNIDWCQSFVLNFYLHKITIG